MCGVVGVMGHPEASNLTYLGLYALQHRGQESAGIVSFDGQRVIKIKKRALVSDAFDQDSFKTLKGDTAIGHVRYATTGPNALKNAQPLTASGAFGNLAVSHNGNLTNFPELRKELESDGAIFQSTVDTEVILHLIARSRAATLREKIVASLNRIDGAFSLLILANDEMIAVRDPRGFRPLVLGKLPQGGTVVVSETCALDLLGATLIREIAPGEVVFVARDGSITSETLAPKPRRARCVFEHIYFARPDSTVFERSVYASRQQLGRQLAIEHPIDADLVTPVPDSGVIAAMGYAEQSKLPLQMGFIRNHYVGRTFIEPNQSIRGFGVKVKLNPVRPVLEGKRVVVIDDSIVRGTTSKKIIKMIRDAGATEISLLITSPPFISPCVYGIDTPTKDELLAATMDLEKMRTFIGVDRLAFLSLPGMYRAIGAAAGEFCDACFTGNYPTASQA